MHFRGRLSVPDQSGPGLSVDLEVDEKHLVVTSGGEDLGRYPLSQTRVERVTGNRFRLTIGNETLDFAAEDAIGFSYDGMPVISGRSPMRPRLFGSRRFGAVSAERAQSAPRRQSSPTTPPQVEIPLPPPIAAASILTERLEPSHLPDLEDSVPPPVHDPGLEDLAGDDTDVTRHGLDVLERPAETSEDLSADGDWLEPAALDSTAEAPLAEAIDVGMQATSDEDEAPGPSGAGSAEIGSWGRWSPDRDDTADPVPRGPDIIDEADVEETDLIGFEVAETQPSPLLEEEVPSAATGSWSEGGAWGRIEPDLIERETVATDAEPEQWSRGLEQTEPMVEPVAAPFSPAGVAERSYVECPGLRSDGGACGSLAVGAGGFCFAHDPGLAGERKLMNERVLQTVRRARATDPDLESLVTRLEGAVSQVQDGSLDPQQALAMASLVQAMCDTITVSRRKDT